MKLTLKNIRQLKRDNENKLFKRACDYVINEWSDYSDKKHIFTDVLYHGCQSGVEKRFKIIEVGNDESFIDGNISRAKHHEDVIVLRAAQYGEPSYIDMELNGIKYKAIRVDTKEYYLPSSKRHNKNENEGGSWNPKAHFFASGNPAYSVLAFYLLFFVIFVDLISRHRTVPCLCVCICGPLSVRLTSQSKSFGK